MGDWDTPPTEAELKAANAQPAASGWDTPPTPEELKASGQTPLDWDSPPTPEELTQASGGFQLPDFTNPPAELMQDTGSAPPAPAPIESRSYVGKLVDGIEYVADHTIVPVKKALQGTIGYPLAEATLGVGDPRLSPVNELLGRKAWSTIAGDEFVEDMFPSRVLEAQKELENKLTVSIPFMGDVHPMSALPEAADLAGQAPLFFAMGGGMFKNAFNTGKLITSAVTPMKFAAKAPTLAKVVSNVGGAASVSGAGAIEGGLFGAAEGLLSEKKKIGETALQGAKYGAALAPVGLGVSATAKAVASTKPAQAVGKAVRVVGAASKEAMNDIADEVLMLAGLRAPVITEATMRASYGTRLTSPPKIPSGIVIDADATGRPVVVIFEVTKDGKLSWYQKDIRSFKDATAVNKIMSADSAAGVHPTPAALANIEDDMLKELMVARHGKYKRAVRYGEGSPQPQRGPIGGPGKATTPGRRLHFSGDTKITPAPLEPILPGTFDDIPYQADDAVIVEFGDTIQFRKPVRPPPPELVPHGPYVFRGKDPATGYPGDQVYVGSGDHNYTQTGTVLGPDPKRPGYSQVMYKKGDVTVTEGIPNKELFPAPPLDQGPAPVPVAPLDPTSVSPATMSRIERGIRFARTIEARLSEKAKDLFRATLRPDHIASGDTSFDDWLSGMQAAKNLPRQPEILNGLKKVYPQLDIYNPALSSDYEALIQQKMSVRDFAEKHKEKGRPLLNQLYDMRQSLAEGSRELEMLGNLADGISKKRDDGELLQYLTQEYRAFSLPPGEWAKTIPSDKLQKGAAHIAKQMMKISGQYNESAVAAEILSVLNATPDTLVQKLRDSPIASAFGSLLERKQIADPIAELLGKETSSILRTATGISRQRVLIHELRGWKALTEMRSVDPVTGQAFNPYFSTGVNSRTPIPIPNNPNIYGKAAGGFTTKEVARNLLESHKAAKHAFPMWEAFGGYIKANQVLLGSIRSWRKNFLRGFQVGVLGGGFDPFNPGQGAQDYLEGARSLRGFLENPSPKGDGALWYQAVTKGAFGSGYYHQEIASKRNQIDALKKIFDAKGEPRLYENVSKFRETALKTVGYAKAGVGKLGSWWDTSDKLWKMQVFIANKRKMMARGMSDDEAATYAARIVNLSAPNFEHVSRLTQKARTLPFGTVFPYLSAEMEELRILSLIPQRMMEDPDFRWQIFKGATAYMVGAEMYSAMRRANGISDEEATASMLARSRMSAQFKSGAFAGANRDAKGRVEIFDGIDYAPILSLANGNTDDPLWKTMLANLSTTPFRGTFIEDAVHEAYGRAGFIKPVPKYEAAATPGGDSFWEFAKHYGIASGAGLLPGFAVNTFNTLGQAGAYGPVGKTQEQLTPGQAARKLAGENLMGAYTLPTPNTPSPTAKGFQIDTLGQMKQLEKYIQSVRMSNLSEENKARKIQAAKQVFAEVQQKRADTARLIQAAQKKR